MSPAAIAALRMRAMEDWDRPAGTVRHQRTAEGWNLQGWSKAGTGLGIMQLLAAKLWPAAVRRHVPSGPLAVSNDSRMYTQFIMSPAAVS
jgi:hypothetical protein